jgi:tetratricopeptide (TPR) repeat protein
MRPSALSVVCLFALYAASPTLAAENWIGQKVVVTHNHVKFKSTDKGKGDTIPVSDLIFLVLDEKPTTIKVRYRGQEGWVDKADVVLLGNALNLFSERIRKNPRDADALAMRGVLLEIQQENEAALKDLKEAIRLKADVAWYYNGRGNV